VLREVSYKNQTLAIYISHDYVPERRSNFLTGQNESFQLGFIAKKKSERVPLHRHKEQVRKLTSTSEFLIVRSGSCKIFVYSDDNLLSEHFDCHTGDMILLLSGSHSIDFSDDTVLIEVKQGPYVQDADKELLE
jgi:cupin fold WbuC family metalloprotein